ncbi:PspA [Citreicoccus inhibens]|uniref:PspA n=1 Tax=Citreicoccus inhibens TaxID=2849499 RepID=UPI002E2DFCE7|nr:PspA [Citreicoccus inhibens]
MTIQNDMMGAIRAVVADEVAKTLGRQVELLEQIARYLGVAPSRAPALKRASAAAALKREVAKVPAAKVKSPAPKRRGRPRKVSAEVAPGASSQESAASPFKAGQQVRYKQGRGSFTAQVTSINEKAGTVTLARDSDGKQVARPFAKVEAA